MEFANSFSAVALTAAIGKLGYSHVKHWWCSKSLRQKYIEVASELQNHHEVITTAVADDVYTDVEDHLEKGAKGAALRHKGHFRHYLVQQGQAKFGCPVRNEANRLVVRKFLYELCVERGLIARHINDHIDIATELVFVPSRTQLTALAIAHTELSTIRQQVHRDLGGPRAAIA